MTIDKFYKQLKGKQKFATRCGISAAHLSLLGHLKRRPSPQLAAILEKESFNLLDKIELLYPRRFKC